MNINFCLTNKQGAKIGKASESANKKRQDIFSLSQTGNNSIASVYPGKKTVSMGKVNFS
jgi:hypothetical protein